MPTPAAPVQLSLVNIFAEDLERLAEFYREALTLSEVRAYRTEIFVMLEGGGARLGINGREAYALLGLEDLTPASGCRFMLNFEMSSEEAVRTAVRKAAGLGARVRKAPYLTPYDYYQAVLEDPEGNIFRLNYVCAPR